MRVVRFVVVTVGVAVGFLWASMGAWAAPVVYSASGTTTAGIQGTVDSFRTALGPLNPNVAGSFGSGRREINWDGVPDAFAAPNYLPANFFNVNSPRGVVFSTAGTGFQVSADTSNPTGTPVEFGNIDPFYPSFFAPFSSERLFTALGSIFTDVNFFVPGSSAPAGVSGFGAVFSDVDVESVTRIQLFDSANSSLGTFFAPSIAGNETFSFIGVLFNAGERVSRVRITSGNQVLATGNVANDLVVMDDFVYGEPVAPPTLATLLRASARRTADGVLLSWSTVASARLAGFNVFRNDRGRWVRLNKAVVATGAGWLPGSSRRYTWLDRTAPTRGALRYRLQALHLDGSRTWLSSTFVP